MSTTNINRAVAECTGKHYINSPSHASTLVHQLHGEVKELNFTKEDDPLLYAYAIHDRMKRIAGLVLALSKWCTAVIEATPDEIEESGAQSCL